MNPKAFHEEHAQHGEVYVPDGDTTYYGDGTWLSGRGIYAMMYSPTTKQDRTNGILRFWELKTQRAIADFDALKKQLEDACKCLRQGADIKLPPDGSIQLRKLARDVEKCREELAKAQAAADEARPAWMKQRAVERAKRAETAAEYAETIKSVNI